MYEKFSKVLDMHGYHDLADIWDRFLPYLLNNTRLAGESSIDIAKMKRMNPYELFNIQPGFTEEEVRKSYKQFARQYHPDVNPDPMATEAFKLSAPALDFLLSKVGSNEKVYQDSGGPIPGVDDPDWITEQIKRSRKKRDFEDANRQPRQQRKERPIHEEAYNLVHDTVGDLWDNAKSWFGSKMGA